MAEFIAGANFSGRSAALTRTARASSRPAAFFVGPYAEAALSGLSSTVADEIAIYAAPTPSRAAFTPLDFADLAARKPPTLSGGEQVLLALHCFSRSDYPAIGIDTALEQLDPENRAAALAFLSRARRLRRAVLVDNRLDRPAGLVVRASLQRRRRASPAISPPRPPISRRAPRRRSRSANCRSAIPAGATSFAMLDLDARARQSTASPARTAPARPRCSACSPACSRRQPARSASTARPTRRGAPETASSRSRRRTRTINGAARPCARILRAAAARWRAIRRSRFPPTPRLRRSPPASASRSLDQHLYELPLVARKRASWLWPLAGALPWIMLDEPTVGQDRATRDALAAAIGRLAALGYGVLFITHDDEFAAGIAHREVRLEVRYGRTTAA